MRRRRLRAAFAAWNPAGTSGVIAAERNGASFLGRKFSRSESVEKGKNVLVRLIRNASSDLEIITGLKRYWLLGNIWFFFTERC